MAWAGRDLKDHEAATTPYRQGHQPPCLILDQAAQGPIQSSQSRNRNKNSRVPEIEICNSTLWKLLWKGKWLQNREDGFRLGIRKKVFFTVRVGRHWHGLPRDVVESPILGDIQGQAGVALSTWWRCRCPCSVQGSWTKVTFKDPFQLKRFFSMNLWISYSCNHFY